MRQWIAAAAFLTIVGGVGACPAPDSLAGSVYHLTGATVDGVATDSVSVQLATDDGLSIVRVPTASRFLLESIETTDSAEAFFVNGVCDGTTWVPAVSTIFTIRRTVVDEKRGVSSTHFVERGETWSDIGSAFAVPTDSLIVWNRNAWDRTTLYAGETVFLENPKLFGIEGKWNFVGADPARDPITVQCDTIIAHGVVPARVGDQLKDVLTADVYRETTLTADVEHPFIADIVVYGGYVTDQMHIERNVSCIWYDPETQRPGRTLTARVYPTVYDDGRAYTLYQVSECGNVVGTIQPYTIDATSTIMIPVKPEPLPRDTTGEAPAPTKETPPIPTEKPRAWVQNGGLWGVAELLNPEKHAGHVNGYGGLEWIHRFGDDPYQNRWMIALRDEIAQLDCNWAYHTRLGFRWKLIERSSWGVHTEAGGWYDWNERPVIDSLTNVVPSVWREGGAFFNGGGWHLRTVSFGPHFFYEDVTYRKGTHLDHHLSGNIQIEPGHTYWLLSGMHFKRPQELRWYEGDRNTISGEVMQTAAARIGWKPTAKLILYGEWNDWRYNADHWFFHWNGPGIGAEWRANSHWGAQLNAKYFSHVYNKDKRTGELFTDEEILRTYGVLTYGW